MVAFPSLLRPLARLCGVLVAVGLLGGVLTACDGGGENEEPEPPSVVNQIDDQRATAGGEALEINLETVFSRGDADALSFSASSSVPDVAEAATDGSMLTVTPLAGGEATITVTAEAEIGAAEESFVVSVFAGPPDRPE